MGVREENASNFSAANWPALVFMIWTSMPGAYWTRWLRYALGMETEYNYGGHTIKVVAFQKIQEPCVWDCTIHIDGNRVPLGLFSTHYPAKHHPNGDEALGYGKKAAEFVVNHPAGSSGTLDELLRGI